MRREFLTATPTGPGWGIAIALIVASALAPAKANAQSAVRVELRGTDAILVNDLPIDVAVLYRTDNDSVSWHVGMQNVVGRSSVGIREAHGAVTLQRYEPLSKVGLRIKPAAPCMSGDLQSQIANLEALSRAPSLEGSREADDAIAAATQLAQLRLQRTRDSLDAERNSMVALTARLQATSTMSRLQLAQQEDKDREESRNETIEAIGYAALAYSEAAEAKYSILSRDADRFRSLLESSEGALAAIHQRIALIKQQVAATGDFVRFVATSIRMAPGRESPKPAATSAFVRRTCTTPAAVEDQILLTANDSGVASAMLADARFDSGESQPVILRRISRSSEWIGTIAWPINARQCALYIQAANGKPTAIKGKLDAGRPSLLSTEQALRRNVEKARKRYKEAIFRAQGADHVKTVILP